MRKFKVVFVLLALVLGLNVFAQNGIVMRMKEQPNNVAVLGPKERFKERLNLTDTQEKKLEALRLSYQKKIEKIRLQIQKIRLNIKEELLNDKIDYNKILQLEKKINNLRNQLAELRINHLQKVEKILRKEQFEKFKQFFLNGKNGIRKLVKRIYRRNIRRRFR